MGNGQPKTARNPKGGGRAKIEIDLGQVEKLAAVGLNEGQVADALGISVETLSDRKKTSRDFLDALKRGKAKGVAKVSNALYEQAMSGQTAAAIFFMKNRAGWTDRQEATVKVSMTAAVADQVLRDAGSDPDSI